MLYLVRRVLISGVKNAIAGVKSAYIRCEECLYQVRRVPISGEKSAYIRCEECYSWCENCCIYAVVTYRAHYRIIF